MYVSVPKNYSGNAFARENSMPHDIPKPSVMPHLPPASAPSYKKSHDEKHEACHNCEKKNKNPMTCLLEAFRGRKDGGFDAEDFLLLGLIALLIGKEGNEDMVFILAMLLLI